MASKTEAFKMFESRLIQTLPLDDIIFKCMLIVEEVFPEDELATTQSQSTPLNIEAKLRDYLVEMTSSHNFYSRVCDLIKVMEEFNTTNDDMKMLAQEMRKELRICKFVF